MISRFTRLGLASVPLAALLAVACSNDGHSPDEHRAETNDAGTTTTTDADAADAGSEAGVQPSYDFAVACASDPCMTHLAARGGAHACAIARDGSVRCWGSNDSGQLGTGSASPKYEATPNKVVGVTNATDLAAAGSGPSGTTCVVSSGGAVTCFGSNMAGQLGRASGASSGPNPDPVALQGLEAKSVILTTTFALAVGKDDRLWSWGADDVFQLARTTPAADDSNEPARADRVIGRVKSYAGTARNGFVVGDDGEVLSWGGGTADQLGRATSLTLDPMPRSVAISGASSITAGASHACALSHGSVHCWGKNDSGQLAAMLRADEPFPARAVLPDAGHAVYVAAGGNNTCAIIANGSVYCWGANGNGQIGAPTGRDRPTPTLIEGLGEQAVALAVMDASICALLRSGNVRCWGDNLFGQLGRGTRDSSNHVESAPVVFE